MIDWDEQNAIFAANNKWQAMMRDLILVPAYYQRCFPNNFEIIHHNDPRAAGGCDTIAGGKRIDEKIVQWPGKNRDEPADEPYTAFALELMSCTTEGHERDGWMVSNTVDFILYCFASLDEETLHCYLIDFPMLRQWFKATLDMWRRWRSDQVNQTECCIVPIVDVVSSVPTEYFQLERPNQHQRMVTGLLACSDTEYHLRVWRERLAKARLIQWTHHVAR